MTNYPRPLFQLIQLLKKLPGVGQKTAERYAFQLLDWKLSDIKLLGHHLTQLKDILMKCENCGCLMETDCKFCKDSSRFCGILCIVSNAKDVYAIEDTKIFSGMYYVLSSLLTPFSENSDDQIDLEKIMRFIEVNNIKEVILALEATIEGDATGLFLKEQLSNSGLSISRLAYGIPLGSTLEFIDGGTLSKAITGRQPF